MKKIIIHSAPGLIPLSALHYLTGLIEAHFAKRPLQNYYGVIEINYEGYLRLDYLMLDSPGYYDVYLR